MVQLKPNKYEIKRRSSAHSAYWMTNALIPAGLIMMYKYGWAIESVIGLVFIGIGVVGFVIYKQKMSVPLITHDGLYLTYRPSSSAPGTIKMDSNAIFTVQEFGLTAESSESPDAKFTVSLLDFDSQTDWLLFIEYLRSESDVTVRIEF